MFCNNFNFSHKYSIERNIELLYSKNDIFYAIKGELYLRKQDIDKRRSILTGIFFIVAGLVLKSVSLAMHNSYMTIASVIILSWGIGFILAGIFVDETVLKKDIKKYTMLPLTIVLVALSFDKFHIDMPILQGLLMCTINIFFLRKEIKKSLKL